MDNSIYRDRPGISRTLTSIPSSPLGVNNFPNTQPRQSPQQTYDYKISDPRKNLSTAINSKGTIGNESELKSGAIDFYIKNLSDNDRVIQFMAYLDPISDSYNGDWQSEKFAGRGEEFFRYTGFSRNLSLGFWVVVESKSQINNIYNKLNYLVSLTTPKYSSRGFMQGNIITLTIGGYIYDLPGILTGVSIDIGDDSTWDIDYDIQAPMLIKVNGFNFKPIHRFLPETGQNFIY